MADSVQQCLGRISSGPTPHLPTLERYMARAPLPQPPMSLDWGRDITAWPLLANDHLGDCTVAGLLHYIQAAERWHDGVGRIATDADAISGYQQLGYNPLKSETDVGASISDVMQRWMAPGFSFLGHNDRISAFARLRAQDLRQALWLFGPLIVGVDLPISARSEHDWSTPSSRDGDASPGSWGGHCMLLTAIRSDSSVDFVTWGGIRRASSGWVDAYIDEAWAVLHPTWVASGRSPSGWYTEALVADMASLSGSQVV